MEFFKLFFFFFERNFSFILKDRIKYGNQRRPNICNILFSFENDILIKIYECQFSGARYFIFYECHFLSTPRVKYCVYYYCRHSKRKTKRTKRKEQKCGYGREHIFFCSKTIKHFFLRYIHTFQNVHFFQNVRFCNGIQTT